MGNAKSETEIINDAYGTIITKIFTTYVDDLASGDEAQAEQHFKNGVDIARKARDRAKTIVQS